MALKHLLLILDDTNDVKIMFAEVQQFSTFRIDKYIEINSIFNKVFNDKAIARHSIYISL